MLVLLVVAAILSPMALPVLVHATYCGTDYRYVRGAHRQKDAYVKGAQGHIYVFDRHMCDDSSQGGSGGWQGAWVMVRRSTGTYYLQSGYVRICDVDVVDHCTQAWAWAEWSSGTCRTCWHRFFKDPLNRYQTYNFKVERRASDDIWIMTYNVIGGSAIQITSVSNDTLRFSKHARALQ